MWFETREVLAFLAGAGLPQARSNSHRLPRRSARAAPPWRKNSARRVSSRFTSSRLESWFEHRYGNDSATPARHHTWVKAHIMCGVKTNVVTAIEIHDRNAADVKQLPALVLATARNFAVAEVSADKAYGSARNTDAIANVGGAPFIALKRNATGTSPQATSAWSKMVEYFIYRRESC